jgi:hypothetical protein
MLYTYYGLEPEQSVLFVVIAAGGMILTLPLVGLVRKYDLLSRRTIIYCGFAIMGASMLMRTGNLDWIRTQKHIEMVYIG